MVPAVPSGRSVKLGLLSLYGIHFLLDHIGSFTYRAQKEVGILKCRDSYLRKAEAFSDLPCNLFHGVHLYTSFGRTSSVPFGRLILTAIYKLSFLYGYMKIVPEKGTIYIIQIAGDCRTSRQSRSPLSRASISASAVADICCYRNIMYIAQPEKVHTVNVCCLCIYRIAEEKKDIHLIT